MFRVQNTILSEDVAMARFACDISSCKGACCVVGDAGAPVSKQEIPVLRKAYRLLNDELDPKAVETVEREGLIQGDSNSGYELSCVDGGQCVFVTYDEHGVAKCAIQEAYEEGRIGWEKPISCHLFPIRLKRVGELDYVNFEYFPKLCSDGCARGEKEKIWLSDFLKESLTRRYGKEWYNEFTVACEKIRAKKIEVA